MIKISKTIKLDRTVLFLFLILIVLVVTTVLLVIGLNENQVAKSLETDSVVKTLFVIEQNGIPVEIAVLAYYPETGRSAMFDIPGDFGKIIQSLERVDRIDVLYRNERIFEFKKEIEEIMRLSIPFYITMDVEGLRRITDLLGGLEVFIPEPVDFVDDSGVRVLLPKGNVLLDGEKLVTYLLYDNPDEYIPTGENRKQQTVISLLKALNKNSAKILKRPFYQVLEKNVKSNISGEDLHSLFQYLVNIDGERLIPQGVTGTYREVDGQMLLFPDRDGETFREIINQSFIELVATGEVDYERIYAIEVLNGTDIQNLARNCGNIYQSFGFDVVRVANASEQNYENTVVIDHISENPMAQVIAQLIRCERVVSPGVDEDLSQTEGIYWENSGYSVDFTIILGRDFNGRYVRN